MACDWSDIVNDLEAEGTLDAETLVSCIFNDTYWVDSFRDCCEITPDENEYLSDDDVRQQIRDAIEIPLTIAFKTNWKYVTNETNN